MQTPAGFTFSNKQLFDEHEFADNAKCYYVIIGNDVWIGNNVIIMDGVKISDGAIIAAGSIVTKNIEPYTIVAGIPAKPIRRRFKDEQIQKLMEIKWWDWPLEEIKKNYSMFSNINKFMNDQKINDRSRLFLLEVSFCLLNIFFYLHSSEEMNFLIHITMF